MKTKILAFTANDAKGQAWLYVSHEDKPYALRQQKADCFLHLINVVYANDEGEPEQFIAAVNITKMFSEDEEENDRIIGPFMEWVNRMRIDEVPFIVAATPYTQQSKEVH